VHKCKGGCHCGRVKIEVDIPASLKATKCNCSICQKSGYMHVIVPAERFRLISGEDSLSEYNFHSGVARHLFCKHCGVKSFYVPRSHPDGFSVNLNCLELPADIEVVTKTFEGRQWSQNRKNLE
jgi:hypothetical protein